MLRTLSAAVALAGAIAVLPAQSLSAETPDGRRTPIVAQPKSIDVASQLTSQFNSARRLLTATADRMPADAYNFKPTPEMRTFGASVAHTAQANFGYCSNLVGKPNPHKGENLEQTTTTKDALTALLKESFDFCAAYVNGLSADRVNDTYQASAQGPDGQKSSIDVARGGLLATTIEHCNEMYGYMAVYLRLKGLVPPSSDPRPARGRGVGPGTGGGGR